MRWRSLLFPLIPLVCLTALSEFAVGHGWVPRFLLPAPSQVFQVMAEDWGTFFHAFIETAEASILGFGLSVVVGLVFALTLSFSTSIRQMFYPYAIFFQTVPIIAIAPILVIWLGYGLPTVVASSFIVSVFPVIANSVIGLLSTPPALLDFFRLMGSSPLQTLFRLRFPAALPQVFTGFEIASGLAVIGSIVGEFISGGGLGGLVDVARNQQRVDRVFGAVLLASVLGVLFYGVISFLSRKLIRRSGGSES
jgi:NitT/TauT family transport system permease protein